MGFANLSAFEDVNDTAEEYQSGNQRVLVGAYSCSVSDSKTEYNIPADDDPSWDGGSEWEYTDLSIQVRQLELADLSAFTGDSIASSGSNEGELIEGDDNAPIIGLTFSALRRDGGYRLYRYFRCKLMSYSVDHQTKGQEVDAQNYTLNIRAYHRAYDNKIRATKDVDKGDSLTWLTTLGDLPVTP